MIASLIKDSSSILNTLAPFEHFSDFLVRLELLEFFVGIEVGVFVVETHDHAQVDKIGLHVVHERSRIDITGHRPVHCVHHMTGLKVRIVRRHLPDLFQTQSVMLQAYRVLVEFKSALEMLSEGAARALCEDSLFS